MTALVGGAPGVLSLESSPTLAEMDCMKHPICVVYEWLMMFFFFFMCGFLTIKNMAANMDAS